MSAAALRFDGIGKTFPGVKALDNISFTAHPGQVHALMGENGAGKSTLLKILGGAYIPSSGSVQIGAQTMAFKCAA
ncbi:ATP-binding cassette domain-containing protein, partial [Pseudomonas veronii]